MVKVKRVKGAASLRVRDKVYNKEKLGAACFGLAVSGYILYVVFGTVNDAAATDGSLSSSSRLQKLRNILDARADLHVQDPNAEYYNALAMDIRRTLDCDKLLNQTDYGVGDEAFAEGYMEEARIWEGEEGANEGAIRGRRRLQAEGDAADTAEEGGNGDGGGVDAGDEMPPEDMQFQGTYMVTGETLFCLAAYPSSDTSLTKNWKDQVTCDAAGSKQVPLLDLWSAARAEMPEEVLKRVLNVASEQQRDLVGHKVQLWAPAQDDGLEYILNEDINDGSKNVDHGGIHGLQESLGRNRVFVDVGSCLGLTSMAVSLLYPGTKIVNFEVASPNWLYQEMNWRCHDQFDKVDKTVILSGVGPTSKTAAPGAQMAKFMWRPSATTSTRSWTPASERIASDIELQVKLRPWHSLLQEAGLDTKSGSIDVLNVDCEGCEYNLIPALSDQEFDGIRTVMGGIHWGYIPEHKLPSSKRGRETHQRLCQHENFARVAKECCAFPDLMVISSVQGEVLVRDEGPNKVSRGATVADVAGDLCEDFDSWATKHNLNTIQNDWGWFQISSMAD